MNRHLAPAALALLYVLPVWGLIRFAPDATAWLLLHAAAPQGALALAQDAGLRGEAYYAQQRWPEAAQAFALAGKTASYNQANALAQAGALEAAIVAYDVALSQEPGEEDASFNRALAVEALYRQRLAAAG